MADTPDTLKSQAKRLGSFLKKKYGWSLPLTAGLEAIAASRGYASWKACLTALEPPSLPDRPILAPVQSSPFINLFVNGGTPTLQQVVQAAAAEHIYDIRLPAIPLMGGTNLAYVHSDRKFSLPIVLSSNQLINFVQEMTLGQANVAIDETSGQYSVAVGDEDVFVQWSLLPALQGGKVLVIKLHAEPNYPGLLENDTFARAFQEGFGKLFLVTGQVKQGKTVSIRTLAARLSKTSQAVVYVHPQHTAPLSNAVSFSFDTSLVEAIQDALLYAKQHGITHVVINNKLNTESEAALVMQALQWNMSVLIETYANSPVAAALWLSETFGQVGHELEDRLGAIRRQVLLPRTCEECSGKGCATCTRTGVKGQVLAFENVILAKPEDLGALAKGNVFWDTLAAHARRLANQGLVSKKLVRSKFGLLAEK